MFHDDTALADVLVEPPLEVAQFTVAGLFERHDDMGTLRRVPLKAGVLLQPGAIGVGTVFLTCHPFIVYRAKVGAAEEDNILVILAIYLVLVGMAFFFTAEHGFLCAVIDRSGHGLPHNILCNGSWLAKAGHKDRKVAAFPAGGNAKLPDGLFQRGVSILTQRLTFACDSPKAAPWNCWSGCCLK